MLWLIFLFSVAQIATPEPITRQELGEIYLIADDIGVPRSVARQLNIEESGDWRTGQLGDAKAIGKEGGGYKSRGLYQLHDKWIDYLIDRYWTENYPFDIYNYRHNAKLALRYLFDLHCRFGTWEYALWYYNCGRITDVPECTKEYAKRIILAK